MVVRVIFKESFFSVIIMLNDSYLRHACWKKDRVSKSKFYQAIKNENQYKTKSFEAIVLVN
jgi:hypothetical protein